MMRNLILIAALLMACGGVGVEKQAQVKSEVVVIFKNAPVDKWLYFSADTVNGPRMGSSAVGAFYVDSTLARINFAPNPNAIDTLVIPTFDGLAEMSYTYRAAERVDFLFAAGDTVVFDFADDKYPIANCVNAPERNEIYNAKGKGRLSSGFSAGTVLSTPMLPKYMGISTDTLIKAHNEQQKGYLQTLAAATTVDSAYLERARFMVITADMAVQDRIAKIDGSKLMVEGSSMDILYSMIDDRLVSSMTYQNRVLGRLASLIAARYAPQTTYTHYGGGGGGSFNDMRVTFDTIAASPRISPTSKRLMLAAVFTHFDGDIYSVQDEIAYKRKYATITGDTIFARNVMELEKSLGTSDDLYLIGVDGAEIGLTQLIASLKGKVVYVDLWGSGCPPCLRVMPDAERLRAQFAGKNVAFLYISCDIDTDKWVNAIKKYNIEGLNYRMTNLRTSELAKKLHIFEFPRYLIYNKSGKLVDDRAVGPNKPQSAQMINRYLL